MTTRPGYSQQRIMSTPRKLYLFAVVVLSLGAIGALVKSDWFALAVFVFAASMLYWTSTRVDAQIARAEAMQREREGGDQLPAEDPRDPRD